MNVNITSNSPPLDETDMLARILYEIYNDGQFKDAKFKGLFFAKPYLDDVTRLSQQVVETTQFYADEIIVEEGRQIPYCYGFREWGEKAQKIVEMLATKNYRLAQIETLPAA